MFGATNSAYYVESDFENIVKDRFDENVQNIIDIVENSQSKKNGDKVDLPDELESKAFQIGMNVFTIPTSAEELIAGGWVIHEDDLEETVKPGDSGCVLAWYQGGAEHDATFFYKNKTAKPVK